MEILFNPILSQNLSTGPDKTYDLFFLKLRFFCRTWIFFLKFTHFFVEFCRDRRLRAFVKILAKSLFSYPCLGQNLSSTPAPLCGGHAQTGKVRSSIITGWGAGKEKG